MVPMRDGVKLATNVFLPEGRRPLAGRDDAHALQQGTAAEREAQETGYTDKGYVRIVQDCRGRFASEGEYRAFIDDMDDGYDTVEWAAAQSWSNGKVGMIGGSAMGITANQAAMSGPPHLVCNVVIVAHGSSYHYSGYPGGVFLKNLNEEWLRRQGVPPADVPRPIHRVYDDSFRTRDIQHYLRQDENAHAQHRRLVRHLQPGQHRLLHRSAKSRRRAGQGQPKAGHGRIRPRQAGRRSEISGRCRRLGADPELTFRWFDHWLKGVDNGVEREPAVQYFVMGDTFDSAAPGQPVAHRRRLAAQVRRHALLPARRPQAVDRRARRPTPARRSGRHVRLRSRRSRADRRRQQLDAALGADGPARSQRPRPTC